MYPPWGDPFGREEYLIGPYISTPVYRRSPFHFTPQELHELKVATAILTLAFAIAFTGGVIGVMLRPRAFLLNLVLAAIAVITAFALHEIGHEYAAIHFGYWAEFNYSMGGLLLALLVSLAGFLFAAPGAVVIYGYPTKRENGIISAAGPTVNLILGMFFFSLYAGFAFFSRPIASFFWAISTINIYIGAFNMIPIPPLDGSKIITWSLPVYLIMGALFALFFILTTLSFYAV